MQASDGGWGSLRRPRALKAQAEGGQGGDRRLAQPQRSRRCGNPRARSGFDFLIIDTEHGAWDLVNLQTTLMAFNGTDTTPIVRVAWNDHVRIKQALDMGVEGILAPMVRTVEECR